jgi:two-component system nitrate/nitrite response regulator NarL
MCDDHRLFAEPFAAVLTLRGHEVRLTTSPAEALRAVDEREPDVCVMDLRFPEEDGIAAVAELRQLLGHLTSRERQVLRHLIEAEDTRGIARALGVAPSTARTHLQNVLVKLGVHTRLQAVALVVAAGIDRDL